MIDIALFAFVVCIALGVLWWMNDLSLSVCVLKIDVKYLREEIQNCRREIDDLRDELDANTHLVDQ